MPESQAHQMVRDFSRLPESPRPETWTTAAPASTPPDELSPVSLAPEVQQVLIGY